MDQQARQAFLKNFKTSNYEALVQFFRAQIPEPDSLFRLSESPIFLTPDFKKELLATGDSLIAQLDNIPDEVFEKSLADEHRIPNEPKIPAFLTIDFGICKSADGKIKPKLIEMQAVPSLFFYQLELALQMIERQTIENQNFLFSHPNTEAYIEDLRAIIVDGCAPHEVVMVDYKPKEQKTSIDFYLTKKYLGISIVDIYDLEREGKSLFYNHNGKRTKIKRIYNRLIFDELLQHYDLNEGVELRKPTDVTWISHPNWYFKISKNIMPFLQHPNVPKSYLLKDFPSDQTLADYVLKPLYSFAGKGVILSPTQADIDSIKFPSHYILQERVAYAPIFEDMNGDFSKAEIRILYILKNGTYIPVIPLVRMTKSDMINVQHNKGNTCCTGSSVAFY